MKTIKIKIVLGLFLSVSVMASSWAQESVQARIDAINLRLEAVQQRSATIADLNELENLQRIYGFYTDKMLWDQVTNLFTESGTMEIASSGMKTGKDSIREYLYSLSDGKQGPFVGEMYNHFQLQPVITLSEDGMSASGRWRAFMQLGTHGAGSGGQWGEGPYENEYIKEDGVWKIKKLHWFATFIGPYEGGWANASKAYIDAYSQGDGTGAAFGDARPAFHYTNPVTGK